MTYASEFRATLRGCKSHRMTITETVFIAQSISAYRTPWGCEKHYTNTLCSAQKQTNLTNSLLQDILVFNGHDTTQLED